MENGRGVIVLFVILDLEQVNDTLLLLKSGKLQRALLMRGKKFHQKIHDESLENLVIRMLQDLKTLTENLALMHHHVRLIVYGIGVNGDHVLEEIVVQILNRVPKGEGYQKSNILNKMEGVAFFLILNLRIALDHVL